MKMVTAITDFIARDPFITHFFLKKIVSVIHFLQMIKQCSIQVSFKILMKYIVSHTHDSL